ncbi:MAG: tetratricopeptide repeat protein [Clostridia bacterium]|nr:tetratricopeptide repeat protein [Clostridia bacterium]
MDAKVLDYANSIAFYEKLDNKKAKEGDTAGRIALWLNASKTVKDSVVYKKLAKLYKEVNLFELSVKYWYKYLDKASQKEAKSEAYVALGNNYYYLGNDRVANYCFNKAFLLTGMLDPDTIDEEVMEFFIKPDPYANYKIAYPPEKVDYTSLMQEAKDKFLFGRVDEALSLYETVPEKSPFYAEARSEMAVAEFLRGETDKGIILARQAHKSDPKNVFALCNLSSMFFVKEDYVNSRKYYELALNAVTDDTEDLLKVAMAACEQREHRTAITILDKLLLTKPNDISYLYLYAVAHFNLGHLNEARKHFHQALSIKGRDAVLEHYIRIVDSAIDRGLEGKENDLKYFMQLPEDEVKLRKGYIKELAELPENLLDKTLKKPEYDDAINWALTYGDAESQKVSVYILASAKNKKYEQRLIDLLLEVYLTDYIKRVIITVLVINGCTRKIGMVVGNVYQKVKLAKLPEELSDQYLFAFAGGISVLAPLGIEDFSKLRDGAIKLSEFIPPEKVKKMPGNLTSALMCVLAGYQKASDISECAKIFHVEESDIKKHLGL